MPVRSMLNESYFYALLFINIYEHYFIAGSKHIRTKFPTVKKKEKWAEDVLIDGRYEPVQIIQVLEVLSAIKNASTDDLAEQIYQNTIKLFFAK